VLDECAEETWIDLPNSMSRVDHNRGFLHLTFPIPSCR
jgi:hypothetical protein